MVDDEKKRNNRLSMLAELASVLRSFANFDEIIVK